MKRAQHCIICNQDSLLKYQGSLAPFIRHYVFEGSEISANLSLCPSCQMLFSDVRFEDGEVQKLYADYRGPTYTKVREQYEPGYTERNSHLKDWSVEVQNRTAFCSRLLSRYRQPIRSVLDFGGDQGQFIPKSLNTAKRYVFDVSGISPLEGVRALASPQETAPYDLVMCCHVLEHLSEPMQTLKELRNLLSPGGALYVEVPAGIPTRRYFEASVARGLIGRNTLRFHEHINYFTKCSLQNALLLSGFRPLETKIGLLEFGWTKAPVIASIAIADTPAEKPKFGRLSLMLEGLEYGVRRNLLPAFADKGARQ